MEQAKLQEILQKHKKWLHGANLRDADLRDANLRAADLHGAHLRDADLRDADLRCADLLGADLRDADLLGADLLGADLHGANLRGADLRGANLDFSCFPLWCGGLDVHIDDRLARQLLYHLLRNVAYSKNTSDEMKSLLLTPELISAANQFHRVDECGKITAPEAPEETT